MQLLENADLSARSTLRVPSRARWLLTLQSLKDLKSLDDPRIAGLRRVVLGGGSNVVLAEYIDAVVVNAAIRGIDIRHGADAVEVTVGAGESWPQLVETLVHEGIGGLENLALIPGSVGAAPVQNIGAYGVELSQRFAWLQAFDLRTGQLRRMALDECGFGYRDSVFKRAPHRFVILTLRLRLPRPWQPVVGYHGLIEALGTQPASVQSIYDAVVALRRQKLPDPAFIPNAGSFFKNPEVDEARALALLRDYPSLPTYVSGNAGQRKLSAAWLIEKAGWRGKTLGDVAVSAQHALVLTNPNHAGSHSILALAEAITHDVHTLFDVTLEREPVVVD